MMLWRHAQWIVIFKFMITICRLSGIGQLPGRAYIIARSLLVYALKIYECAPVNESRHSRWMPLHHAGEESEKKMINYAERELLAAKTGKLVGDECFGVLVVEYLIPCRRIRGTLNFHFLILRVCTRPRSMFTKNLPFRVA